MGVRPIPEYGDLFEIDDFIEACQKELFIDYDGTGHWATGWEMSDEEVTPSDILDLPPRDHPDFPKWTHVMWFNK